MSEATAKTAFGSRRRQRFGLSTLLIAIAIVTPLFAWTHRAKVQREAVAALLSDEADCVAYDYELDTNYADSFWATNPGAQPPGPKFLRDLVGIDYLATVAGVIRTHFTDENMAWLEKLPELQQLELGGCRITNEALRHIEGHTQLRWLNLAGCDKITDAGIAHLSKLTRLRRLNLYGCGRLTNAALPHLARMSDLRRLSLSCGNSVDDSGLSSIAELKRLEDLDLDLGERGTDAALEAATNCIDLRSLTLRFGARPSRGGLHFLGQLPKLERLTLLEGQGMTDDALTGIDSISALKELRLDGERLTDDALTYMGALLDLKTLSMNCGSKMTAGALQHVAKLQGLTQLDLTYNESVEEGFAHLRNLRNLKYLRLSGAPLVVEDRILGVSLTDESVERVSRITQLTSLVLHDCQALTDVGIAHLKSLKNLGHLYIGDHLRVTDRAVGELRVALPACTITLSSDECHLPG